MKFTIFRNKKDGADQTVQVVECNSLIDSMKANDKDDLVRDYRGIVLALGGSDSWEKYRTMYRVCPVSEYSRKKSGEIAWKGLSGVVFVEIKGINNALELQKAKKIVAVYP